MQLVLPLFIPPGPLHLFPWKRDTFPSNLSSGPDRVGVIFSMGQKKWKRSVFSPAGVDPADAAAQAPSLGRIKS